MKPAPKWFVARFAKRFDIEDRTVQQYLAVLWRALREGQKVRETNEYLLGDEYEEGRLTSYGRKLKLRRARTAQIAKASRRANRRKAAVARRQRQKRNARRS